MNEERWKRSCFFFSDIMLVILIEFIFGRCLCGRGVRSLASGMAFVC